MYSSFLVNFYFRESSVPCKLLFLSWLFWESEWRWGGMCVMCDIKSGFNSQEPASMLSTIPASCLSYKNLAAFSHFFSCNGQHHCVITSIFHQKTGKKKKKSERAMIYAVYYVKASKHKSHNWCEPHEKDIISLTCYANIYKKLKMALQETICPHASGLHPYNKGSGENSIPWISNFFLIIWKTI